jgi:hypothetical protein
MVPQGLRPASGGGSVNVVLNFLCAFATLSLLAVAGAATAIKHYEGRNAGHSYIVSR